MNKKITILGAGSWGLANADLLAEVGHKLTMWEFDPNELAVLIDKREHPKKLPGLILKDSISLTNNLVESVSGSDVVIFSVPAQRVSSVCQNLSSQMADIPDLIINLSKGVEEGSLRRMSEVIRDEWRGAVVESIVTISGPSHAEEVARRLPTSVVVAGDETKCREVQEIFKHPTFRVYRSDDLIGVELAGSLKNVIAIAAGIVRGLGLGDNTQGALISRGLVEINRLATELGARSDTLVGLSGVGDLVTTCISEHSRNQHVGFQLGRGKNLQEILDEMVMVAEGVTTCRSARELAKKHNIEMPITEAVCSVLFENAPPAEALARLMNRPLKAEVWH